MEYILLFLLLQLVATFLEEDNGNPLQYSNLENPMDGGASWAAVYGVTQSQTRLKRLSSSSKNPARPWLGLFSQNHLLLNCFLIAIFQRLTPFCSLAVYSHVYWCVQS